MGTALSNSKIEPITFPSNNVCSWNCKLAGVIPYCDNWLYFGVTLIDGPAYTIPSNTSAVPSVFSTIWATCFAIFVVLLVVSKP
jgi:hypothetical protein